jgi:hypothetical protein
MEPKFKPPRSRRLKLRCVIPLSYFAFKFNLRRYATARRAARRAQRQDRRDEQAALRTEAGAYTYPLFGST